MAKNSRVPGPVGSIPIVGDLMKQADSQAQWLQDLIEQNTRLVGQLPATIKSFNDTLERFNQTVGRLDRMITRVETTTDQLMAPIEEIAPRLERVVALLDIPSVRDLPGLADSLRREALPALRATTDTQRQIALLQTTIDRVLALLGELPGMGLVRRFAGGRPADVVPEPPIPDSPQP
jgi:ABC-type transporter Mla subunit MlaD